MSGYRFYHIDPDGIEYPLTDGVNTWLQSYAGLGMQRLGIAAERVPYQHGRKRLGEPYLPDRLVAIGIGISDETHAAWVNRDRALIHNLSPFKNPSSLCALKVLRPDDVERRLAAWLVEYGADSAEMDGPVFGKRTLIYWAEDPAFYDPTAMQTAFGVEPGGGFTFPVIFPVTFTAASDSGGVIFPITFPITFEAANVIKHQTINYAGSLPTWPVIRCYGPGDYPKVENETEDQLVQVVQALDSGDYVDIDMDAGIATFYDASDASSLDITSQLTDESQFWQLRPGENNLRVVFNGVTSNGVRLTYYNRYLAI